MPVLKEMTASTSSIALLKRLLKSREHVIVPKLVLLKDEETDQISQIPTEMLLPNSEFCIEDILPTEVISITKITLRILMTPTLSQLPCVQE